MKTILSTKVLSPIQKELLINSGLNLVEYNALHIDFLKVKIPLTYQNYIFTSQNAAQVFIEQTQGQNRSHFYAFCVGEKTKALLEDNGIKVLKTTGRATDLARHIVKARRKAKFLFVCGNLKREELPKILFKKKVTCDQLEVYTTQLTPKKFDQQFEGVLFFSPSGIQSYTAANNIGKSWAFCIGDTTAHEAKKHTNQITIPPKPTIDNVLMKTIQELGTPV